MGKQPRRWREGEGVKSPRSESQERKHYTRAAADGRGPEGEQVHIQQLSSGLQHGVPRE